jgi:hypothetical protein
MLPHRDVHPPLEDLAGWRVYLMHAEPGLEQRRRLAQARGAGMEPWTLAQVVHAVIRNLHDQSVTAARESDDAWACAVSLQDQFADGFA